MKNKININWSWELSDKLEGIFVVADVYAATTNIASLLARGAKRLLIVNKDSVFDARDKFKDALVIGESLNLPEDFFDASNVPWNNQKVEVKGKTVIYMSNNGTRVIESLFNKGARLIVTVSFTNMSIVLNWLKNKREQKINLIPAGESSFKDKRALEDLACVETLRDLLLGRKILWKEKLSKIDKYMRKNYKSADFDTDLRIILNRNSCPVLPLCKREKEGLISVKKITVSSRER